MKGGNTTNPSELTKINFEMPASMAKGSPNQNALDAFIEQGNAQNAANGQVGGGGAPGAELTCAKAPGVAGQSAGAYGNVGCELQQAYYNQQAQAALDSNVGEVVQSGGAKKRRRKRKSAKRKKTARRHNKSKKVRKSHKSRKPRKSNKSRKSRKSRK